MFARITGVVCTLAKVRRRTEWRCRPGGNQWSPKQTIVVNVPLGARQFATPESVRVRRSVSKFDHGSAETIASKPEIPRCAEWVPSRLAQSHRIWGRGNRLVSSSQSWRSRSTTTNAESRRRYASMRRVITPFPAPSSAMVRARSTLAAITAWSAKRVDEGAIAPRSKRLRSIVETADILVGETNVPRLPDVGNSNSGHARGIRNPVALCH